MCGRYALYADKDLVKAVFDLADVPDYEASYNIAPTQPILAITADQSGRHAGVYRWGLVPFWAKELGKFSTINARAETVASKPAYRTPFKQSRCLIPANGYFEWKSAPDGKRPFYIHAPDDHLLAFAGLWDRWKKPDGETLLSAAIIVTDAGPDTRQIHDRMPVILPTATWDDWLDPGNHDKSALAALLERARETGLVSRPVSPRLNSPKNNDPTLLESFSN